MTSCENQELPSDSTIILMRREPSTTPHAAALPNMTKGLGRTLQTDFHLWFYK